MLNGGSLTHIIHLEEMLKAMCIFNYCMTFVRKTRNVIIACIFQAVWIIVFIVKLTILKRHESELLMLNDSHSSRISEKKEITLTNLKTNLRNKQKHRNNFNRDLSRASIERGSEKTNSMVKTNSIPWNPIELAYIFYAIRPTTRVRWTHVNVHGLNEKTKNT